MIVIYFLDFNSNNYWIEILIHNYIIFDQVQIN